jgi:hypothetical protein
MRCLGSQSQLVEVHWDRHLLQYQSEVLSNHVLELRVLHFLAHRLMEQQQQMQSKKQ